MVVPLKDERGTTVVDAFQKMSEGRKSKKHGLISVVKFTKNLSKIFLKINDIEMHSTYNKGKSVIAERFTRTLKSMIFKHMTAISKNVYIDMLDDIVNKYNNTVHRSIKMKPIDVTCESYIEYNEDANEKDPKFKVGDLVRISKYKNIFAKGYTQNWSEEVFVDSKIKNTVPWTYGISDLNVEKIARSFCKKEWQKINLRNIQNGKKTQKKT